MPIKDIIQPEIIQIDDHLRLRKFDDKYDFALEWYQDIELVYLVDGVKEPYTIEKLADMYHYLEKQGEEYFIEVFENHKYIPIGDVTFWKDDMPIVIGNSKYRRIGIGKKVIKALIQRGIDLGYNELYVEEIYKYNIGSRHAFESCGFSIIEETEKGYKYILRIDNYE